MNSNVLRLTHRFTYCFGQKDSSLVEYMSFENELNRRFGLSVQDFKEFGEQTQQDELTTHWLYKKLILEISIDRPYYRVYEGENIESGCV